jgi:hypothetical protein
MSTNTKDEPVKELGCCCCGNSTRGRQWYNRDTGYGICSECIAYVRGSGMSEAEIRDNYGIEGVHFSVQEAEDLGACFERNIARVILGGQ